MIWDMLLQIRETLKATPANHSVTVQLGDPEKSVPTRIKIDEKIQNADIYIALSNIPIAAPRQAMSILAPTAFSLSIDQDHALGLTHTERLELETYLPYALLPCFAATQQRTLAISHFAQTLDGKIATRTGDSRWIGNPENLTHAHRMRALCDAILVGARTLQHDKPQLTVRHVSGQNPLRVVIGNNSICELEHQDNQILQIRTQKISPDKSAVANPVADSSLLIPSAAGELDCAGILNALYLRNVRSVYIEGGASTTSAFLRQQALDQVQIHIAPRILGSGLTGFTLNEVDNMNSALQFHNPRFLPVGDEVMFVGEI